MPEGALKIVGKNKLVLDAIRAVRSRDGSHALGALMLSVKEWILDRWKRGRPILLVHDLGSAFGRIEISNRYDPETGRLKGNGKGARYDLMITVFPGYRNESLLGTNGGLFATGSWDRSGPRKRRKTCPKT